jgi:hypothetical protein
MNTDPYPLRIQLNFSVKVECRHLLSRFKVQEQGKAVPEQGSALPQQKQEEESFQGQVAPLPEVNIIYQHLCFLAGILTIFCTFFRKVKEENPDGEKIKTENVRNFLLSFFKIMF